MGSEFEIKGILYRSGKLDAFQQLYITRRFMPALGKIVVAADGLDFSFEQTPIGETKTNEETENTSQNNEDPTVGKMFASDNDDIGTFILAATDAIYALSDKDMAFVLKTCLGVVKRKDGSGWAPVMRKDQLMYEDINLVSMIRIAVEVIKDNLSDFFSDLPSNFKEQLSKMSQSLSM